MAKVSKSVREKRKDFAKTKLKVGKSKQLPANHTDTSFRSKAIVLPKQSVTRETTVKESQTLQHYLALIAHKSGDTRRDAMQQLTSHLVSHPPSLSTTITPLMKALCPIIIDDTVAVRRTLYELFQTVLSRLTQQALNSHTNLLLLYIASAMTHISPSIRSDSTKFLAWTLAHTNATQVIILSQLGKFMDTFSTLFGWAGQGSQLSNAKALATHLKTFDTLLDAALVETAESVPISVEYSIPFANDQECFVAHRSTTVLLQSCQTLNLFRSDGVQDDADLSNFHTIEPHLPIMLVYFSDKFIDSVNGDRSLCLPILEIMKTLVFCDQVKGRKDIVAAMKKIGRGMDTLQDGAGQGIVPGLVGIWRLIQEESTRPIDEEP